MWKHLTSIDRREISILYRKKYKQCEIATELWITPDIISKELKRNSVINQETWKKEYIGSKACLKHYQRRKQAKYQTMKINSCTPLKLFIIAELKKKTPPKEIAFNWNNKIWESITITHESIYKWLETWSWNKYKKFLLHQYSWYKKKKNWEKVFIPFRIPIEQRPQSINNREENGHFEWDLIVSKKGYKWVLFTLIDRVSRRWYIIKLPNRTTAGVMKAVVRIRKKLWIKSITFDNGKEFSHHYKLWKYWIKTYFCNPYSSWEKWSVENFNKIIRRWFPKGTIFDYISQQKIRSVMNRINNTPREILWFLSPNQVHYI